MAGAWIDGLSNEEADAQIILSKLKFVEAVRAIDPLAALRKQPLVTVGMAASLGLLAGAPIATKAANASRATLKSRLISLALTRLAAHFVQHAHAASASTTESTSPPPT